MWRPEERIKYKPQPGPWPTREEAESSLLFSPIDIGPITLRQRTWVPAMVPWRATEDGFLTEELLDWYGRYAEGKPGRCCASVTTGSCRA
jgi:2,4-dienoyl-CoA reductase-like NADH-dependent reductase (Old Yellow Enzyme family)